MSKTKPKSKRSDGRGHTPKGHRYNDPGSNHLEAMKRLRHAMKQTTRGVWSYRALAQDLGVCATQPLRWAKLIHHPSESQVEKIEQFLADPLCLLRRRISKRDVMTALCSHLQCKPAAVRRILESDTQRLRRAINEING